MTEQDIIYAYYYHKIKTQKKELYVKTYIR